METPDSNGDPGSGPRPGNPADERPAHLAELIEPPIATASLPGVGGRLRARPEDFQVDEVPAYETDGRPGHLFVPVTKRGWNSEDVARDLARHLRIDRREIGMAGLKDRDAVTTQWISVPDSAAPALATYARDGLTLGPARAHGHKLRRGHLRGNQFTLVVRDLATDPETAIQRLTAKAAALAERGGLDNFFGAQRFGRHGSNLERGLAGLRRSRPARRADIVMSAGQSALFNHYLLSRRREGLMQTVLPGDLLKKRETGGMFPCEDAAADQARMDRGELVVTGPIFGSKMRSPAPQTPSAALERRTLEALEVPPEAFSKLGKKLPGTRRPLLIEPEGLAFEPAEATEDLGTGVRLRFFLPAGSYATQLCRELMLGA